jgi:hypothetical protein
MRVRVARGVVGSLIAFAVSFSASGPHAQEDQPVVITLERTQCFGACPAYTLRITGNGHVEYEGRHYVRVVGKASATIAPDAVRRLVADFERIGYFELQDKYTAMVTDNPTTTTSIRIGSRFKRVIDYVVGPPALKELERRIDDTAGSMRWVSVDAATVRELQRGGWTGSRPEAARYLQDAVGRGDEETVRALVDAGADPNGGVRAALTYARGPAMIKLLVASGADVNHAERSGETPLMSAAQWSTPEIVAALLEAKANINAVDEQGTTAMQRALRSRESAQNAASRERLDRIIALLRAAGAR